MQRSYDYKKHPVLYVDDEKKSLKYFSKAFKKDFEVMTVDSAEKAWDILEDNEPDIGVVVTDQRMPKKTGVELLSKVRRTHPDIVRILTTAYSNLDNAIEAVNSGSVFRYVVKPWNIRDLRGTLLRAMEFFLIQRERDTLLREKLSVLERLMVADRVRSLAAMAAGLSHHVRNSMSALVTFLDMVPSKLREELSDPERMDSPEFWNDLWSAARKDSERLLDMVREVDSSVVDPQGEFTHTIGLSELVHGALELAAEKLEMDDGISAEMELPDDLPELKVNRPMAEKLLGTLIKRTVEIEGDDSLITISARTEDSVWGTPGVQLDVTGAEEEWCDEVMASLFNVFAPLKGKPDDLGLELLSAYFIAHHHGGDITVQRSRPDGPGFRVVLPQDPSRTERPGVDEDFMRKVFTHSQVWEDLQQGF